MLFSFACNSVPENWHSCVNKGHTYLLTYVLILQHSAQVRTTFKMKFLSYYLRTHVYLFLFSVKKRVFELSRI